MSKEEEVLLILKVIRKMHETPGYSCERSFAELDRTKIGYLTLAGLKFGLPSIFDIHLTRDQLLLIFQYMDTNGDGIVTLREFTHFFREIESQLTKEFGIAEGKIRVPKELNLVEIFSSLIAVLQERRMTLLDILQQMDKQRREYGKMEREFAGFD